MATQRKKSGRRSNGEGSVYRDASRRLWVGEKTLDGKRRRVYGKDKTEARANLARLIRDFEAGVLPDDRRLTVADAVEHYLKREVGGLAPSTLTRHRWAGALIVEHLGTRRLHELREQNVEKMFDQLEGEGLAQASLSKVRSTFSLVLDVAVRRGQAPRNVARNSRVPLTARPPAKKYRVPDEMLPRLREALAGDRLGAMWLLMLEVGLRWEESAGLRWDALDGNLLRVMATVRRTSTGGVEVVPEMKNEFSRRTLRLEPALVEVLRAHRIAQNEERLRASEWQDPSLMFATTRGTVLHPNKCRRLFVELCDANGITVPDEAGPRAPRPHELRHTARDLLAEQLTPEQVTSVMGWSSDRMYWTNYHHPSREPIPTFVEETSRSRIRR